MRGKKSWRCFYCTQVFTREQDAAEHFGNTQGALAGCQIKGYEHGLLKEIRELEEKLATYRAEDSNIIRAWREKEHEQAQAVRHAEEVGYGRGVRDMQKLAVQQTGAELVV